MKVSQMLESKYLKAEDLDGQEHVVTIQGLKKANLARDDEEPKYRWVIKFAEFPKGMVLNATNIKRLEKALGDDTEFWSGREVIVYYDEEVMFGSEQVGGLRVKGIPKEKAAPKPSAQNAAGDDTPW